MQSRLHDLLAERGSLLADGATGTNYFSMGLNAGDAPEMWNVEHPERVARLHRQFVDAGADILLTNSFGGTRYRLQLHHAEGRVAELNEAAARIAKTEAARAGRPVLVAGSMGPTGEIFEPVGSLSPTDGEAAFREQAEALAAGGADVLWLETLSSREEVEAGLKAADGLGLPVVCTVSFDTNGATMMGVTPRSFAEFVPGTVPSLCACGTNCGVGAAEVVACISEMKKIVGDEVILVAKANCGIPQWVDDAIHYDGTPALMADYVHLAHAAGARIIGGCCGTSPDHLQAMRAAMDSIEPAATPDVETIENSLGHISDGIKRQITGAPNTASPRAGRRRRRG
ncbi:MAG: betaine--homocysteine S-methyltransferase [Pseudomonadota bacterium]